MAFNTTAEIIDDIRAGKMVVLMDDEDRENEGDLLMAATHVRPEDINFMITHARGLVCLTITADRSEQLNLPLMSDKNGAKFSTNVTVSIDAAQVFQQQIAPEPSKQQCHRLPSQKTSYNRDIYSQLWHKMAVCYIVRVILKPAVT